MTNRLIAGLLGALLLAPAAYAQSNDDWEGFKAGSSAPAPGQPAAQPQPAGQAQPSTPAQPAPQPAPESAAAPAATPSATPGTAAPASSAPSAPVAAADGSRPAEGEATLVSTKESVVGEEVEHSPSTLHNSATDPRNVRNAAGEAGPVGVLHVGSAELGPARVLHVSVSGEYFRSNNFPVLTAEDTRTAGVFALSYNFLDWLEGYASYTVTANTNSHSAPRLIQDQGDASFGLAVGHGVARGLSAGVDARLLLQPGTGNQDFSRSVLGFFPRAMGTYDFHALSPSIPLRAHLNLGVLLDKTSGFAEGHSLTAAEEFALQTNRFNRFAIGGALEVPLPAVTPFVEYDGYIPMGAKNLVAPDNTAVSSGAAMAQTLGLGVRVTAIQDLTLNAAVDLGLSRTVAYGIPATPPYNVLFGATYSVDPFGTTRTKVVDRTYERKTPTAVTANTGRIEGTAIDASTGKPLPGVLVAFADRDLPPVASDTGRGRFLSYDLAPGPVKVSAQLAGYQPASADAVVEPGKTNAVQVRLTPEPKPVAPPEVKQGSLSVKVTAKRKPLATASVTLAAANGQPLTLTANGDAAPVPVGHYTLSASAEGFEPQSREIDVVEGKPLVEKFELKSSAPAVAAPKRQLVVIVKNKLVIKQQVHFATNKAVILRDSFGLLDQVADTIKSNGLKKVLVEGHTDNQGPKDTNLKLSQDRANSVRNYLLKKGVPGGALEAKGFGDTKPIAPNMTAKGREQNRRVEFTIEEK